MVNVLAVAMWIVCDIACAAPAETNSDISAQSNRIAQLRANEARIIFEAPLLSSRVFYSTPSIGLRLDEYGDPVMVMGDGRRRSMAGSRYQPIRSRLFLSTNVSDAFSGGRLIRESTHSLSPKVHGVMPGNAVVIQVDDRRRELTVATPASQQEFSAPFRSWEVSSVDAEGLVVKVVMGNTTNLARFRYDHGALSERPLRIDAEGNEVKWE